MGSDAVHFHMLGFDESGSGPCSHNGERVEVGEARDPIAGRSGHLRRVCWC